MTTSKTDVDRLVEALRLGERAYHGSEDYRGRENVGGEVEVFFENGRFMIVSRQWHGYGGHRGDEHEQRKECDEAGVREYLLSD